MKPAYLLLTALAVCLATTAPPSEKKASNTSGSAGSNGDLQHTRRATGNMEALVNELRATRSRDGFGAVRSVGGLWMEVDQLKRTGQNVRQIEWYVSDLEGNLRSSQQDASARRHILNNLDYEIDALNRRLGRR